MDKQFFELTKKVSGIEKGQVNIIHRLDITETKVEALKDELESVSDINTQINTKLDKTNNLLNRMVWTGMGIIGTVVFLVKYSELLKPLFMYL